MPAIGGKSLSVRNKSRHYLTHTGRTVVIKDDIVYTNKGSLLDSKELTVGFTDFKQAKLLYDTLIFPDSPMAAPLLVYYIDRLLLPVPTTSVVHTHPITPRPTASLFTPKQITSLPQLFDEFPSVAKQVIPQLTSLLRDLNDKDPSDTDLSSGVEAIKRVVDGVITAVVDTFHSVDATSMKRLTDRTDLNGEKLARLIESYVLDESYDVVFFSFSKSFHDRDTLLTDQIHSLKALDVHQVGIPYINSDILSRLLTAIERFRTFGAARTPMEKLEILLETVNVLSGGNTAKQESEDEKSVKGALSSDFLIPLLLLVVIRSNVSNLESNLAYVREFSYGDTEGGIIGYTLSSIEAVLYHIGQDHLRLAELSRRNEAMWKAIKAQDLEALKTVLETPPPLNVTSPASPTRPRSSSLGDLRDSIFESRDVEGNSCLMMALQIDNLNILYYLLSRPRAAQLLAIDENYQHETPIVMAMQAEKLEIVEALTDCLLRLSPLEIRQSLARQDKDDRTVGHFLYYAPDLILKLGKYIPWATRDKIGQTPLSIIAKTWDHKDYQSMLDAALTACIESIGLHGEDHVDGKGNSLLHVCADEECMKRLLDIDSIDPNVVNVKGLTPLLHWAKLGSGRLELVKLLFQSPRVDAYARDPRGLTVLHLAAWKGHFDVLQEAVKWIDVNERAGGTGVTALHVAAREKRMECIEYLVGDWNADLPALEGRGLTAGDMAKDEEVRERLDGYQLIDLSDYRTCSLQEGCIRW